MSDVPNANLVPWRPPGMVIAIQYWSGDEAPALRLARLIADIEPDYRSDLILALVRRFDLDLSGEAAQTIMHCNGKLVTYGLKSETGGQGLQKGTGHPDGANALWDGTMALLSRRWASGDLNFSAVFTVEADGCPIAHDWSRRLLREHAAALAAGKHITGPLMRLPFPHINGTMVCNVAWWMDHPSLRETPTGYAWDLHHRDVIVAGARPTQEIRNIYGSTKWSDAQLGPMSNEAAWLASVKDDSAISWAEQNLTAAARAAATDAPNGWRCRVCTHVNPQTLACCLKCGAVIG